MGLFDASCGGRGLRLLLWLTWPGAGLTGRFFLRGSGADHKRFQQY